VRLIILAAGQGFKLDGFNKILLKDPVTKKTILDYYLEYFSDCEITVVVGYRSITIMNEYPQLNYIYNKDWRIKGNSYSLALALTEEPCIILPSDLFFDKDLAHLIKKAPNNMGLTMNTENRTIQSLHCNVENGKIASVYKGNAQPNDPEVMGVFKITNKEILKKWRKNCIVNDSISIGENLPIQKYDIFAVDKQDSLLYEINTPNDYVSFINLRRSTRS